MPIMSAKRLIRVRSNSLYNGIDLSMQRARQVREQDFERFDLLLAMDKRNLALLQAACPVAHKHKLGLLMEYAQHSDVDEVPDPYYGGERGFDQVLDYIEDAADGLLLALQRSS